VQYFLSSPREAYAESFSAIYSSSTLPRAQMAKKVFPRCQEVIKKDIEKIAEKQARRRVRMAEAATKKGFDKQIEQKQLGMNKEFAAFIVSKKKNAIEIHFWRDTGDVIGDGIVTVKPGQIWHGVTFDQLLEMEVGEIQVSADA
jgi:hypothetical protein